MPARNNTEEGQAGTLQPFNGKSDENERGRQD